MGRSSSRPGRRARPSHYANSTPQSSSRRQTMRAGFLKPLADLISRRTKSPAPVVLHRRRAPRELKSRTTQSSVVWRSMQIRPYSNVRRRISARCSRNCISPSKRSARPLRAVSRLRNFLHFSRIVRHQRAGIVRLTLISAEARQVFAPVGGGLATGIARSYSRPARHPSIR